MPTDIGTRSIQVADGARDWIATGYGEAEPNEIVRQWFVKETLKDLTGRRTWIYPESAKLIQRASKNTFLKEFRIDILTVEKFEDAGVPPDDWVDRNVEWFGQYVHDRMNLIAPSELLLGSLWTETLEIVKNPDPVQLSEAKIFWALCQVGLREIAA